LTQRVPDHFSLLVAKELGNPPEEWVTSVLKSGRGLVLFDGVDEIPSLHRDRLKREIEAIIGAYPDNYFMLSTRPTAVPENWLADLGFREGSVNPMSEVDRARFIENWHEAVAHELRRYGKPGEDLPAMATELTRKLAETPSIARLGTNPLLCAMICALHRERSQILPESQPDLCEALCATLLHRRERESGLDLTEFPEAYRSLLYDHKRAIVQELAHYMVRNGESSIAFDLAEAQVADALRHFPGRSPTDAGIVCRGLVERSGILREARPGHVDFVHNTIKEYLAADRFVEDGDSGALAARALDPTWQFVVMFAVGTRKRGFATEVIRRILGARVRGRTGSESGGDQMRSRQLFALRCRAMALHLDPVLEERLVAIEQEMFPPRTMGDAEALAASGDTVIQFLRYRKKASARETSACIRTLRLIGTPAARGCLSGYVQDRRMTVVSELAHAVNPLEINFVREHVERGQRIPDGIASQVADVSLLSTLKDLTSLNLGGTQVVDLSPLRDLEALETLDLRGTRVNDLGPLAQLSRLRSLNLDRTRIRNLGPLAAEVVKSNETVGIGNL